MKNEKAKHTPGPWVVTDYGEIKNAEKLDRGDYVCRLPFQSEFERQEMPEASANARILSAAIDMYEALQRIVDVHENGTYKGQMFSAIAHAKQAIDKAEGR